MKRVELIYRNPLYQSCLAEIRRAEEGREYCGHDIDHFLDVARLAWIENLEEGLGLRKDIVYGAALLHDIGRARQYTEGIPHDQAGVTLAGEILPECGYSAEEIREISRAIAGHRLHSRGEASPLAAILKNADHKSRKCYACPAEKTCYWPQEKKNLSVNV